MKYLNDSASLNKEFSRLLSEYNHYYWMIAWAGNPSVHIQDLVKFQGKIKQMVVGFHFYQTSPDFIERFNPLPTVRFIKSISGVFHPKVYLFINDPKNWEALIGSANFTNHAFNKNNEASILIHSWEAKPDFLPKMLDSISTAWKSGTKFTAAELEDYRRLAIRSRHEDADWAPGDQEQENVPFQNSILSMSWREFIDKIFASARGTIAERIKLLDIVAKHFRQYPVFSEMPPECRRQIGGYVWADEPVDFRLFGNMQYARTLKQEITNNPGGISDALAQIPSKGRVTQGNFQEFVRLFKIATEGGNKYRSGTRLLAMKRADIFFAISKGNNKQLAEDFGITNVAGMDFTRYWTEIILPMRQSDWYRHPAPINQTEQLISNYRAAFMDAIYYQPDR